MLSFKQYINEDPSFTKIIQHLGKKTGLEHAFYRNRTTRQDSPIIVGDNRSVSLRGFMPKSYKSFPETEEEWNKNPFYKTDSYPEHSIMHNHPGDTALSGADTWNLFTNPKMKFMHAVTPSGSMYAAKRTPLGEKLMMHPHSPILDGIKQNALKLRGTENNPGPLASIENHTEQIHLEGHILHMGMHKAGIINYRPSMRGGDISITEKHKDLIDRESNNIADSFKSIANRYSN